MKYNIVISGPSGAGKGTLINKILSTSDEYYKVVSCTTRKKRPEEIDGINYHFLNFDNFKQKVRNKEFFEVVEYDQNYYGILNSSFNILNKNIIFDVVVGSGLNIKTHYPENTVLIYILPESLAMLNKQRGDRGSDRLLIDMNEIEIAKKYDYLIKNNTVDNMYKQFCNIMEVIMNNSMYNNIEFIDNYYCKSNLNKKLLLKRGKM